MLGGQAQPLPAVMAAICEVHSYPPSVTSTPLKNVMTRLSLVTLAVLLAPGLESAVSAQRSLPSAVVAPIAAVRQSEAQVREMPLEKRPNRLGHFYGNTIRRRKAGSFFVNRKHSDRPLARYFYIAR